MGWARHMGRGPNGRGTVVVGVCLVVGARGSVGAW